MKVANTGGYGRYDDDPEHVGCPRAKSDMTPCIARDGGTALTNDTLVERIEIEATSILKLPAFRTKVGKFVCVGCSATPGDLLKEIGSVPSSNQPTTAANFLKREIRRITTPKLSK